jgi:hypothetical protein
MAFRVKTGKLKICENIQESPGRQKILYKQAIKWKNSQPLEGI